MAGPPLPPPPRLPRQHLVGGKPPLPATQGSWPRHRARHQAAPPRARPRSAGCIRSPCLRMQHAAGGKPTARAWATASQHPPMQTDVRSKVMVVPCGVMWPTHARVHARSMRTLCPPARQPLSDRTNGARLSGSSNKAALHMHLTASPLSLTPASQHGLCARRPTRRTPYSSLRLPGTQVCLQAALRADGEGRGGEGRAPTPTRPGLTWLRVARVRAVVERAPHQALQHGVHQLGVNVVGGGTAASCSMWAAAGVSSAAQWQQVHIPARALHTGAWAHCTARLHAPSLQRA